MRNNGKHVRPSWPVRVIVAIGAVAAAALGIGPAMAAQHAQQWHRVACAAQEDSRLKDCHGHYLDYRHGGWYAPGPAPSSPGAVVVRHDIDSGAVLSQLADVAREIGGHHFATFTYVGCNITTPAGHSLGCLVITVSQSSVQMSWGNGSAAPVASKSTGRHIPSWLRVGRVHQFTDCHNPGHKRGPGVIVWQKGGDPEVNGTSALHCENGKTFVS